MLCFVNLLAYIFQTVSAIQILVRTKRCVKVDTVDIIAHVCLVTMVTAASVCIIIFITFSSLLILTLYGIY